MVFSTCENVGEIFETLRHRLDRKCRARQIGHVGVKFPVFKKNLIFEFSDLSVFARGVSVYRIFE